ncbi:MAG: hypothetical protein K2X47_16685 [Bdellovibrionales bacterium]|nr:hypothetical protein [Bdellovibrionales bacterium]
MSFFGLKKVPSQAPYGPTDYVVVFGELFGKGYANGFLKAASDLNMKVIGSTVGRREGAGPLRELNPDELASAKALFPFETLINVPLEAGFDFEPSSSGRTPVNQMEGIKMDAWASIQFNWDEIKESREKGAARFLSMTRKFLAEVEKRVPADCNIIFLHTMAGGIPRARIMMPTMNRIFKGRLDRFVDSRTFWDSPLGRLSEMCFSDVTAGTFQTLIQETAKLRERQKASGKRVQYLAYGYHGTEILIGDAYRWQTYSPYLQGWAKKELEDIAKREQKNGVHAIVYNCPEILTNSSNLFQGVEVPLYPFVMSLVKEAPDHPRTKEVVKVCQDLLKPEFAVKDIAKITNTYFKSDLMGRWFHLESWPQHSEKAQMEMMLETSAQLIAMHKDEKATMTLELSRDIFEATGFCLLHDSWTQNEPVVWLGHDVLSRVLTRK